MKLRKKRPSQPIISAESNLALVRYSRRASATLADDTVLPAWMVSGCTTPDKRMYSVPLSSAICFSPATIRLPLGSTSTTVTVTLPLKVLLELSADLSAYWLDDSAFTPSFCSDLSDRPATALIDESTSLSFDALDDACLPAWVFSLMTMVSTSPTWRARRSSNSGRYAAA